MVDRISYLAGESGNPNRQSRARHSDGPSLAARGRPSLGQFSVLFDRGSIVFGAHEIPGNGEHTEPMRYVEAGWKAMEQYRTGPSPIDVQGKLWRVEEDWTIVAIATPVVPKPCEGLTGEIPAMTAASIPARTETGREVESKNLAEHPNGAKSPIEVYLSSCI